jgi:acyl-CoA thioesterase-1
VARSLPLPEGDRVGALTVEKFLRHDRPADARQVVVCAGDSITQGVGSANWIGLLHEDLGSRGHVFVNAGRSGYLSCSLLRDLDEVIACRPDVVTVMIGTNDVMATMSDLWRDSYQRQDPPEAPTIETYRRWVDEIVTRLAAETSARVALIQVPPISEELGSDFNQRVDSFNEVVAEVAAAHDIEVLPLNTRLKAIIAASSTAPPFDGTTREIKSAIFQRLVLRRRWDKISARAGRAVLTDNIHLNDRAAGEVAALVRTFVENEEAGPERTATVGP